MRVIPQYPTHKVTESGSVFKLDGTPVALTKNQDGYLRARLRLGAKSHVTIAAHRLVAMAYCAGYSEELTVNHLDGNKTNNHYTNLEWVSRKQNMRHASRTGLLRITIPDETVVQIQNLALAGVRVKEIVETTGVDRRLVYHFINGQKRAHLFNPDARLAMLRNGAAVAEENRIRAQKKRKSKIK